jgi:hypothetical protein
MKGEIMVRHEVEELQKLGPFPSSDELGSESIGLVDKYGELLSSIEEPVNDEEAKALTGAFGGDDFFGLCWTLVHLIETAPNWPIDECLENVANEWIKRLKDRATRWREAGYPARSFYEESGLPDPRSNRI